ncbi:hypothetical protein AYI70_g9790 [Smittium culicis]|uniref:Uncharacterized protein n=1 Tax=Smittium culicis TaxID=133412 RepID=A0A1R1X9M3_9FUNG|nr:hypothetical protein AYI70_g9790 [Smittium culicis]
MNIFSIQFTLSFDSAGGEVEILFSSEKSSDEPQLFLPLPPFFGNALKSPPFLINRSRKTGDVKIVLK